MDNSILSEISLTDSKNQKFNSKEEELEFYKHNYKIMEKNLLQCETKIKTLETSNKKLQQLMNENARGGNNTSVQFFLPSEFKKLWENLTETELLAPFDNFINNYIFIANICQDLTILTYNETKEIIEKKVDSLLICLGVKPDSNEQRLQIISKFIPFFQEYFLEIFHLNKDNIQHIKNQLIKISNLYTFDFNKNDLEKAINDRQFDILLDGLFGLCLHMLLHDPLLTFNIIQYDKRVINYYYYDKKEFQSIEGFGNEKTPCIIILPPPVLRNSFPFNGMKAVVYLIENPTQDMINQCDLFKKEKEAKNQNLKKERKSVTEKKNISKNIDNKENLNINKEKIKIELFKAPISLLKENIKTIDNDENINENKNNDNEKELKKNVKIDIITHKIKEKEIIKQTNNINNLDAISNDSEKDIDNRKEMILKGQKLLEKEEEKNQQTQKIETPSNKKRYEYNIYEENPNGKKIDLSYNNYIKNTANLLNSERVTKNNIFEKPPLLSNEEIKIKQTLTPNYTKDKIIFKNNDENKNKTNNIPFTQLYSKYINDINTNNINNSNNTGKYSVPNFNFEKNKNIKKRISNNNNNNTNNNNNNSFSNIKLVNNYYQKDDSLKDKNDYYQLFNTIPYNFGKLENNINKQNLNELYKKYSDYHIFNDNNYYLNYNFNNNDNYISSVREIYQKRNNNNNENYKNNYLKSLNINSNNNNNNNYNLNKIGIDLLKRKYNINSENENQNKFQSYSFNY